MKVASALWIAVAVLSGFLVLLGYFVKVPALQAVQTTLLRWAVLLAAAALMLGLHNLWSTHWRKVNLQQRGWIHSATLIFFFVVTFVLGLLFGTDFPVVASLFTYVQLPVESALMALLAVTLAVAGFRHVARRRDLASLIFVGTAFVVLLGSSPWLIQGDGSMVETLTGLRSFVSQVLAAGGARGILLGVALGVIATGVRILVASDRPYGD
ncbi:MAG TPA: hypothetical protein VJ123_01105 [Anaerolineales bacterium]|nr:hypothetical protein [Anaerolineales bacterium]